MSTEKKIDEHTGTELTKHEWDGLEELDTPMPKWWLGIFYLTIIWAIIYMVLMPAIPSLPFMQGYSKGMLGKSDRVEVATQLADMRAERSVQASKLVGADLAHIESDPDLLRFANAQGKSLFGDNCETCHGANGQGFPGFPNLNDDIWIWGGSYDDIKQTVRYGIRSLHDETRFGDMLAYGKLELLNREEIDQLVQHVLKISGQDNTADIAGAELFEAQCASCHGVNGKGNHELGAANLTDNEWLYGGDAATIRQTIYYGRAGMMPNWNERLSEDQIAALAFYVHSLGGGE